MRTLLRSGAMTLAAALLGATALVTGPALAASDSFQVAQAERDRGGDRGDRGSRGGDRGDRGARSGGETRTDRGARSGSEMRMDRAPRGEVQRFDRQRSETRRDMRQERRIDRGDRRDDRRWDRQDRRDDRRWDRRDRRETYQRFHRHRPEYRTRYPFVYLGGPRVVVRGYGEGWCRGLHRGYHWAPRIGWHYGTHAGLYRCW